jgi:hypothetical protein
VLQTEVSVMDKESWASRCTGQTRGMLGDTGQKTSLTFNTSISLTNLTLVRSSDNDSMSLNCSLSRPGALGPNAIVVLSRK